MCCVALPCCLLDLTCFFLPSFSSLINVVLFPGRLDRERIRTWAAKELQQENTPSTSQSSSGLKVTTSGHTGRSKSPQRYNASMYANYIMFVIHMIVHFLLVKIFIFHNFFSSNIFFFCNDYVWFSLSCTVCVLCIACICIINT